MLAITTTMRFTRVITRTFPLAQNRVQVIGIEVFPPAETRKIRMKSRFGEQCISQSYFFKIISYNNRMFIAMVISICEITKVIKPILSIYIFSI